MSDIYRKIYQSLYNSEFTTDLILELLSNTKKQSPVIYDIGCGYGFHFDTYLRFTKQIYGVDSNISCVEYCREKYPSIHCNMSVELNWPSPDFVFLNFNVLNYLSEIELTDILTFLYNKLSGQVKILADFLDAEKLMFGAVEKVSHVNVDGKTFAFINSLDYPESGDASFTESVFERHNLVFECQHTLKIWNIEDLKKCLLASGLSIHNFKTKSMPNNRATVIEAIVS